MADETGDATEGTHPDHETDLPPLLVRDAERSGRETAWLGDAVLAEYDVSVGDVVEVSGRRKTAARVRRTPSGDTNDGVSLSRDVAENADVRRNDFVTLENRGPSPSVAREVTFYPSANRELDSVDLGEKDVKDHLMGRLLSFGDVVSTGDPTLRRLRVGRKKPYGPVTVGDATIVRLRDDPDLASMKTLAREIRASFDKSVDRRESIVSSLATVIQLNFLIASIVLAGLLALADDGFSLPTFASSPYLVSGSAVWLASTGYAIYLNRGVGGGRYIGLNADDLWGLLERGEGEFTTAYFLLESYVEWMERNVESNQRLIGRVNVSRIATFVSILLFALGILVEL